MDNPDLRCLAVAVTIQSQSGGNLAEILQGLAKVIRARFKLFRRIKAITAEAKWSGGFLSAFPLGALVMIVVLQPGYSDAVKETAAFITACLIVAVLLTVNVIFMKAMLTQGLNMDLFIAPLIAAFGPLYAVGGLGLALILVVLPQLQCPRAEPFDKLKSARAPAAPKGQALRRAEGGDKLQNFSAFLGPKDAATLSAARLRMLRASHTVRNALRLFHFAQFALGIGFLIFGLLYTLFLSQTAEVSTRFKILATLIPGAAGYYLPQFWMTRRVTKRQKQIIEGFPDTLDLMLVCIEAGHSLDQSINLMAKETRAGSPALADEIAIVRHEVKAGKERVAVPDISSFVTTLVQSATYGTSIAEAVRIYSSEMHDKRVMRAEKRANRLPTKLTLGTMLFNVPPLMIILNGPSVMGISKMLAMGAQ